MVAPVTVVVPTHNRATFLDAALSSVAAQTFADWECLIVDDASMDETPAVVASHVQRDARFRSLRNQLGLRRPGAVRNRALREVESRWVAFLDDDDLWLPGKLALQWEMVTAHPEVALCFGRIQCFGAQSNSWPPRHLIREPTWRSLLARNFIPTSTVLARLDAVREAGGFGERRAIAEDYELWLRLARRRPILGTSQILCRYRVHPGSILKRAANDQSDLESLYAELAEEWGLSERDLRPARRNLLIRRAELEPRFFSSLALRARALLVRP